MNPNQASSVCARDVIQFSVVLALCDRAQRSAGPSCTLQSRHGCEVVPRGGRSRCRALFLAWPQRLTPRQAGRTRRLRLRRSAGSDRQDGDNKQDPLGKFWFDNVTRFGVHRCQHRAIGLQIEVISIGHKPAEPSLSACVAATREAKRQQDWPRELVVIGAHNSDGGGRLCLDTRYQPCPVVIEKALTFEEVAQSLFVHLARELSLATRST